MPAQSLNLQRVNQWKSQMEYLIRQRIAADVNQEKRSLTIELARELCETRGLRNLTDVPPRRVVELFPADPTDFDAWPTYQQLFDLIGVVRDEQDQAERQLIIDAVRAGKPRSEVMSLIHQMYVVDSIGAKELEQLMTQHSQRRLSEAA